MRNKILRYAVYGTLLSALAGCGGGGSGSSASQTGNVSLSLSDASSEDWATIGVKVLSIALIPQGGGADVTVYTAPATPPVVNLEQLDQLSEIIGNVSVPVGTYVGAVITIAANPGDVALIAAAAPEAGFVGTAGAAVAASNIQIQGSKGTAGNKTETVTVNFKSDLVVGANQNNQLDLEFDLANPAFLMGHVPVAGLDTGTRWAVDFNGMIRHHPIADITHRILRHMYGTVNSISSDNTSISIAKDEPTWPIVNPETATSASQTLTILADATNGTLVYDVDAKTSVTVTDFASESGLLSSYVRIAARYQQDGTLVATRIWTSKTFNDIWLSPEGHVLHVNNVNNIIDVTDESGGSVPLTVDSNTTFTFHDGASPIGTGTAFLSNMVRGFKVHATVVDPLATPLVAQTVDIETAAFDGAISGANSTGFTYTRRFVNGGDNYTQPLVYIDSATANGKDASGNPITGFKWWNFAFPTVVDSGSTAIADFVNATTMTVPVNFGGTVGTIPAVGVTYATWGDAANTTGWSAPWVVLEPTPLPLGKVAAGYASNSFTMTVAGGSTTPVTVDVDTTSGSATLVYQVDRTNGVVTVSPEDITSTSGLAAMTAGLVVNAPVKVYGVPQPDGSYKAYVLTYYTGTLPSE